MKTCPDCGYRCSDSDIKCHNCGFKFSGSDSYANQSNNSFCSSTGNFNASNANPIVYRIWSEEVSKGWATLITILIVVGIFAVLFFSFGITIVDIFTGAWNLTTRYYK